MNILTKLTAVFTVAGLYLVAAPVFAIAVDGEAGAGVDANADGVRVFAQDELDVESEVEVDTEEVTDPEAADLYQTEDETVDEETEDSDGEEGFIILRSDVIAETDGEVDGTVAIDPVTVTTEEELESYAREIVASDEHAERVEASAEEVSLTYKQSAQLFAFIPVLVDATVTVDESGNVSVEYPWYHFLTQVDDAGLRLSIETSTETIIGEEGETGEALTVEERALVLSELYGAMSARIEGDTNTEVEVQ